MVSKAIITAQDYTCSIYYNSESGLMDHKNLVIIAKHRRGTTQLCDETFPSGNFQEILSSVLAQFGKNSLFEKHVI